MKLDVVCKNKQSYSMSVNDFFKCIFVIILNEGACVRDGDGMNETTCTGCTVTQC